MYQVVLADDEAWVMVGLKKLIEKSNLPFVVVGQAEHGVAALEEIEKKRPNVLFTDIRMPGIDGLTLLEKLAERGIAIKVVYISGYAEFEYARRACSLGAFDYLLKPVEQEKMNDVLLRLAGQLDLEVEGKKGQIPESGSADRMDQIIQEIQRRYTENLTLTDLAESYGVSISHLSAMVKAKLNMPFSDYVTMRRLEKAKQLLRDEALSIQQVADQAGYQDYFYFTKVFKKNVGISPSKFRKQK